MKHTLTLAAWNFRLARRSLLALWGIFAAQQLALVVVRICWQGAAGMGLASHYYVTMQIFAYLGFYLLTGLAAGLATHNSRRARSGYTWATLPGTPGQKFGAKAITIAAAEVVFTAWQFVWYIVEFYPVTALEVHLARKLYGAALPPANLYEQVVANNLLSRLLLAALDTVRGWRKLPVFAVGGLCAWQCFYLVTVEQHPAWMFTSASRNVAMALAAVLAVLTVWWAVRSIRRGETC